MELKVKKLQLKKEMIVDLSKISGGLGDNGTTTGEGTPPSETPQIVLTVPCNTNDPAKCPVRSDNCCDAV